MEPATFIGQYIFNMSLNKPKYGLAAKFSRMEYCMPAMPSKSTATAPSDSMAAVAKPMSVVRTISPFTCVWHDRIFSVSDPNGLELPGRDHNCMVAAHTTILLSAAALSFRAGIDGSAGKATYT
jgi:hypothetical protein